MKKLNSDAARLNYLDELVEGASKRRKVFIENISDVGSQGNKVIFRMIDDSGEYLGDLTRTIGDKGRKLQFKLKINGKTIDLDSYT